MNRRSNQSCNCSRNTNTTNALTTTRGTEMQSVSLTTSATRANGNRSCDSNCDCHDRDRDRDCDCDRDRDRDRDRDNDFTTTSETNGQSRSGCNDCDDADETASSGVFSIEGCCDFTRQNIGALSLSGVGQVINASLTLCNVCPNRTVAVGVTLAEIDRCGCETNIAFKSFEITSPRGSSRNIKVRDIIFVVPKDDDNRNRKRCFRLHATANYLDTNVTI